MITPEELEKARFTTTWIKGGYDQAEVDDLLDKAVAALRDAAVNSQVDVTQIQRLKAKNAALERELGTSETQPIPVVASESASRLLQSAQKTADDLLASAKADAEALVADAEAEAVRRRSQAEAEAYRIEQEIKRLGEVRETTRAALEAQLNELKNTLS